MVKNKIFPFLLLFFCFFSQNIYCQTFSSPNKYTLPQLTPQSPNAASFGKYGEIPVSLGAGTANISVPLLNIKVGSFELPINLSNHNNGLKVDEIPSFVGLGWNLNVGGVINYQQKGNPDFSDDGVGLFTNSTYNSMDSLKKYLNNQMNDLREYNYGEQVIRGDVDAQYDLYHFNFMGHSGSFYFDSNQHIICVPKSNLKISRPYEGLFIVIDEKGNQYYFGQPEYNETSPSDNEVSTRKSFSHNASYYLTGILTSQNRSINFSYTSYPYAYQRTHNYVSFYGLGGHEQCPNTSSGITGYTNYSMENYLLTSVSFDEGSIQFELSSEYRQDLKSIYSGINVPYLRKVKLLNNDSIIINEFLLHYYNNASPLLLTDIIKDSSIANHEEWKFEYYGDTSFGPGFFSHSKDHWGYYNGASNSTGLPQANYASFLPAPWTNPIGNAANRESNFAYSICGVLKKITYPTGGTTSFEYEPNRVVFTNYSQVVSDKFLYVNPPYSENIVYATTDYVDDTVGTFTLTEPRYVRFHAIKTDLYNGFEDPTFVEGKVYLGTDPYRNEDNIIGNYLVGHQWECNIYGICESNGEMLLNTGTYYWGVYKNILEYQAPGGYSVLELSGVDTIIPYQVGGVRISSVISNDSVGYSIRKRYIYADRIDSVHFRNIPYYIKRTWILKNRDVDIGIILCDDCGSEYKIHDESVFPLVGNSVNYIYVTELTDDSASNGKIDYKFTIAENLSLEATEPYVTPFLASWKGGLINSKKIYKKEENDFVLLQKDSTIYESTYPADSITKGIMADYWTHCEEEGLDYRVIAVTKENYQTEKFYPKSSAQTLYDNTGSITTGSSSSFTSTKHTLPTETSTVNSKNENIKNKIKYSADYDTSSASNADAQGIRFLQRKNVLAPIENIIVKTISGTDYVIGGTITTYKADTTVPARVYQLKITSPVLLSGFTHSSIASGSFIKDSRYEERAEFSAYDAFHNILQARYSSNIYKSYIWNYQSVYPVAEVTNATVNSIAYTSFEATGKGNWMYSGSTSTDASSPTGTKCYNLGGGNITKSGLTNATYIVSYWSKGSSYSVNSTSPVKTGKTIDGWTYYEHEITGTSITISGSSYIDEVRLYPKGAMMTTFAFLPLIGMTAQCDFNNHIIYYEYDEAGKLKLIRDEDKKILKKIEYKLKVTPQ